jgi:hypothetical protein
VRAATLQIISHSFPTESPDTFSLFQNVTLNATGTEARHFNKNVNAEEILGEESAELSDLHSVAYIDICRICKKILDPKIIDRDLQVKGGGENVSL